MAPNLPRPGNDSAPRKNLGPLRTKAPGIAVLLVAGVFLLLGLFFLGAPHAASVFFGIEVSDGHGLAFVRAIGARDIALAGYLAALVTLGSRGLSLVLGISVVIPLCDVAIVTAVSGLGAAPNLALHLGAGMVLAILAWWTRARTDGR